MIFALPRGCSGVLGVFFWVGDAMKCLILGIFCAIAATEQEDAAVSLVNRAAKPNAPVVFVLEGRNDWTSTKLAVMEEPERNAVLQVFVAPKPGGELPKDAQRVFGKYRWENDQLIFESRFGASAGVTYRAVARFPGKSAAIATCEATIPKKDLKPSTKVTIVYPTANELPENLLKFYVHFSAPMSTGEAYKHIALETSSGQKIVLPFLEIAEELWDKTNTRLTLLLDPGRIKRGLVPREEDGPILVAGQAYRFRVMADWPDAEGAPLVGEVVKEFKVIGQDTTQPAPLDWKIITPRAGGKDPIVIDLLEPLDHAIVARGIRVYDADGVEIEGGVALARQEREWRFTPDQIWRAGAYELRVDDVIEDLVGNNVTRPFELDRFDEVKAPEEKKVRLKIEVK
jgi:hypothetical protein